VFAFAFVLFSKNPFEPTRLLLGGCLVFASGFMKDDVLLTATITSEGAHLLEVGRSLSRLTFLDRYRLHALHFISPPILHCPVKGVFPNPIFGMAPRSEGETVRSPEEGVPNRLPRTLD
jgi:hypothetical protein